MQIKSYVSLTVYVTKIKALKTILFLRIMYVLDFFMNFVSMSKIESKKMYWNSLNQKLIKKKTFFTT